jgi:hypothetical protein
LEEVLIREMQDEGEFGPDLSSSFTFTVENDGEGKPRLLKIHGESPGTLSHRKW